MAFRLRYWILAVGVWIALIALWLVPPRPRPARSPEIRPQEVVRYDALKREARRTQDVLERTRWSDSLATLATTGPDGVVVGGDPDRIDAATLRRVRDELAAQVDPGSDVTVGFFVLAKKASAGTVVPVDTRSSMETYVGTRGGRAYCLRVLVTGGGGNVVANYLRSVSGAHATKLSDVCRLVARYGLPGPDIESWLEDGATTFAAEASAEPPARRRIWPWARDMSFHLGQRWNPYGQPSLYSDQCMASIAEGCGQVFLHPLAGDRDPMDYGWVTRHSPALAIGETSWGSAFGPIDDYVLSDLESQFGRDAFARFWTSDAPVEEAFRTAFGVTPGDWMLDWLGRNVRLSTSGPRLPLRAGVGVVLTLVLCALAVGAVSRRRKVT